MNRTTPFDTVVVCKYGKYGNRGNHGNRYAKHWRARVVAVSILALPMVCTAADAEFDDVNIQRGYAAKKRGDWVSVASQFAAAINNTELPVDGPGGRAAATLEYGRAMGVLCQYAEAEKFLLRAKDMMRKTGDGELHILYELGAVNFAQQKYADATRYFSQMLARVERDVAVKKTPWLIADTLDKFAVALDATGQAADAKSRRDEAATIRESSTQTVPANALTPYGRACKKP